MKRLIFRKCTTCKLNKEINSFYPHKSSKGGRLSKCAVCKRNEVNEYRKNNENKVKEYDRERGRTEKRLKRVREYAKTDKGKAARLKASRLWKERNKEKYDAHRKVGYAIKTGKLVSMPCLCGEKKTEAHHEDYNKPLEVLWLCDPCHKRKHKDE
jgi:hypothetical protein